MEGNPDNIFPGVRNRMNSEDLKALLAELHRELEGTDRIDSETHQLVKTLQRDIDQLHSIAASEESGGGQDAQNGALTQAEELEIRFAAEHPRAEGLIREIIDILGKMGV